jgi:hypothetical protein
MTKFTSAPHLREWVNERVSQDTSNIDSFIIADIIKCSVGFPAWGEDATQFISTLPVYLEDLYNAYGEE